VDTGISAPASSSILAVAAATLTLSAKVVGSSDSKSSGNGLVGSGLIFMDTEATLFAQSNLR